MSFIILAKKVVGFYLLVEFTSTISVGGVVESSYSFSEMDVSWVISLTTLHYSWASIYMPYLDNFEDATDFSSISPMQGTHALLTFQSLASSLV